MSEERQDAWNTPTYNEPKRMKMPQVVRRVVHNPRWDKTIKHIRGEKRHGRL